MAVETTASPTIGSPARWTTSGTVSLGNLRQLRPVFLPIATAGALLLVWQAACLAFHIPAVILPPPSDIAADLWRILPLLLHHAVPTTLDSLAAFFIATVLGVGL